MKNLCIFFPLFFFILLLSFPITLLSYPILSNILVNFLSFSTYSANLLYLFLSVEELLSSYRGFDKAWGKTSKMLF